jgi:hypothetical protein
MIRFRAVNQSLYQVPILYSWGDITVEGALDDTDVHTDAATAAAELQS